jgi:hypothetical protein
MIFVMSSLRQWWGGLFLWGQRYGRPHNLIEGFVEILFAYQLDHNTKI